MSELRKIDINLVVVLDALLDEKNLTRAAAVTGMTQPAVSASLSKLRRQLNDPLLVRAGRTFELTERAAALRPDVKQAIRELLQLFSASEEFDPSTSERTFHVAGSDYALAYLTGPLLAAITESSARLRVQFEPQIVSDFERSEDAILSDLVRQDVTIIGTGRGIALSGLDQSMPGEHQALFSDTFVCIAARDNPVAKDGAIDLEGLRSSRYVRSYFGENVVTQVDTALADAGLSPAIGLTVQGFLSVPWAVSGTDLIGFVPERVARQYQEAAQLQIVATPLPRLSLVEAAFWHPSKSADPARQWLVGRLRRAAELLEFAEDQDDLTS